MRDPRPAVPSESADGLRVRYRAVRAQTESLCTPLAVEDHVIQSMPEASPIKWHLAHTAWFFETFVLVPLLKGYRPFDPRFAELFNSYYQSVGAPLPRGERGVLSRPTVAEVHRYRAHVDEHIGVMLRANNPEITARITLGLHHEQQHQELMITDLKHAWSVNPLDPAYAAAAAVLGTAPALTWIDSPECTATIGHAGPGFAFDNESPRHRVLLRGFRIANRLVTNGEYRAFMADGGYERPELWLSDGWTARHAQGWQAPLYWRGDGAAWQQYAMSGWQRVDPDEPVCHVSFYEADAFARWAKARLPTEAEWEHAASDVLGGHFAEAGRFHPAKAPADDDAGPVLQLFGDVWQWTASPYVGYPGYRPAPGALGEYNGKFMCNQLVLRGASCATPRSHARRTYRNFFPPEARWQFSGIRLARDAE